MFPLQMRGPLNGVGNYQAFSLRPNEQSFTAYRVTYETLQKLGEEFFGRASKAFANLYTVLKAPLDCVLSPLSVYLNYNIPSLDSVSKVIKNPLKGFSATLGMPEALQKTAAKVNIAAGAIVCSLQGQRCNANGRVGQMVGEGAASHFVEESYDWRWFVTPYSGWTFNDNQVGKKVSDAFGEFAGFVNKSYDTLCFAEVTLEFGWLNIAKPYFPVSMGFLGAGSIVRGYSSYNKRQAELAEYNNGALALADRNAAGERALTEGIKTVDAVCMTVFAGLILASAPFTYALPALALGSALKVIKTVRELPPVEALPV